MGKNMVKGNMFRKKINIILGDGKMINKMAKEYTINMGKKLKDFGQRDIYFQKLSIVIIIYLKM
jgi:hypothetical protein